MLRPEQTKREVIVVIPAEAGTAARPYLPSGQTAGQLSARQQVVNVGAALLAALGLSETSVNEPVPWEFGDPAPTQVSEPVPTVWEPTPWEFGDPAQQQNVDDLVPTKQPAPWVDPSGWDLLDIEPPTKPTLPTGWVEQWRCNLHPFEIIKGFPPSGCITGYRVENWGEFWNKPNHGVGFRFVRYANNTKVVFHEIDWPLYVVDVNEVEYAWYHVEAKWQLWIPNALGDELQTQELGEQLNVIGKRKPAPQPRPKVDHKTAQRNAIMPERVPPNVLNPPAPKIWYSLLPKLDRLQDTLTIYERKSGYDPELFTPTGEQPKPQVETNPTGEKPYIFPPVQISDDPDALPHPVLQAIGSKSKHKKEPPRRRNERERKVNVKGMGGAVLRIAGNYTEMVDFIDAMYDTLPSEYKLRWKKTDHLWHKPPPYKKLQQLALHWDKIKVTDAVAAYFEEYMSDLVAGAQGQLGARISKRLGLQRGAGVNTMQRMARQNVNFMRAIPKEVDVINASYYPITNHKLVWDVSPRIINL